MPLEPRRRFRFLQEISEGSFGKVYLAEMITGDAFSTVVAIKLLHGKWLGHEEIVMRSRDEARLLGLLRHQNIIRVEDLTSINGQCAVVMEYLDGVDLKSLIAFLTERRTLFPRHAASEITGGIAAALEAAYNHRPLQGGEPLRVIHRDIKPSNVMVTAAGEVKVLDFGTARANFQDREAQTQALAFGSQAYMAPERKEGEPDSPSGDVFSLGVTLYELLALDRFGTIYIREERFRTALQQNLDTLDLTAWPDPLAGEVRTYLGRMMDYRPENRPSAAEVVETMEDLAEKAKDLALRRFCRRYVADAVSRREPLRTPGDPLTGSTLVEDASSAFGTTVRPDEVVSGPFPQARRAEPPAAERGAHTTPFPSDGEVDDLPPAEAAPPPVEAAPEPVEAAPEPVEAAPEPVEAAPEPPSPFEAPEPVVEAPPAEAGPLEPPEPAALEPPPTTPVVAAGMDVPAPEAAPEAFPPPPPPPSGFPSFEAAPPPLAPPLAATPAAPPPVAPLPSAVPRPPPAPRPPPSGAAPPAPPPAPRPPPPVADLPSTFEPSAVDEVPVPPSTPSEPYSTEYAPQARRPGGLKFVIIGLVAVVVVAGVAAVFVLPRLLGGETPAETPPPTVAAPEVETPLPSPPPAPTATGAVGTIVLHTTPAGGAIVTTTSSLSGYRDVWDGQGERILADLPVGTYKTRIKLPSGTSIRSTLEVRADQRCGFTFDLSSGSDEWHDDGCE